VLDDPAPRVRRDAVRSLGQIGQQARIVVPQVRTLLKDKEDIVRKAARDTLQAIAPETLTAKPEAEKPEAAKPSNQAP
jgi:HEAT repeat protein